MKVDGQGVQGRAESSATTMVDAQMGLLDGKSDDEVLELLGPSDVEDRNNRRYANHGKTESMQLSGNARKPTHAQLLLAITENVDLFHTPAGDGYATLPVDGHVETWPLRSRGFTGWLRRAFYEDQGKPPNSQAVADALAVLEARAQFDGFEHPVFVRLGEYDGRIYLDLANEQWEAIEAGPEGWCLVARPPVRFRRARGMLPLPHPEGGGTLAELRQFVNVHEADWPLVLAWLIAALRPCGPYPALDVHGEQGSAKSTMARALRALVDPSTAPLRASPRDERDLMIAASNSWVLAFDNVSWLPDWLSDALCRLATGGGLSTRQLYTDQDEIIFAGQRPIIVNGIGEFVAGSDLRDRVLTVACPPIGEAARRDEKSYWMSYEAARPRLLGALLDGVSIAQKNLPTTALTRLPRMADFALWVTAAEPVLGWPSGAFLSAYTGNRRMAFEQSLELDPVGFAVRHLAESELWEGAVGELLERLRPLVAEHVRNSRDWPQNARGFSNRLHRLAPALRQVGVLLEFGGRTKKGRAISIRKGLQPTITTVTTDELDPLVGDAPDGRGDGSRDVTSSLPRPSSRNVPTLLDSDGSDGGEDTPEPGLPSPVLDNCTKCGSLRRCLADGARCCPRCHPDGGGVGWAEESATRSSR